MTASVVPFPPARRQDLVRSIARRALSLSPEAGEKHISHSLTRQFITMTRKGVSARDARLAVIELQSAVRAVMWTDVLQPREGR